MNYQMENSSFSAAAASGHPAAALVAFSQANEALRLSARPFPPQVPFCANYKLYLLPFMLITKSSNLRHLRRTGFMQSRATEKTPLFILCLS